MRHYVAVAAALVGGLLVLFALVELAGVPLLSDPAPLLESAGPAAAVAGTSLLVADVVLPVPSSAVMVAHGALFGVMVGAALSTVGSVGGAILGFAAGRRSTALIGRVVPAAERERADALLQRWGAVAVVVTRPVPLLAEATVILAGTGRSMSWPRLAVAAAAGSLPPALLYAWAGAAARGATSLGLVFGLVLVFAALTWLVEMARRRSARDASAEGRAVPAGREEPPSGRV